MATLSEIFTNIANAIRSKTGNTATMTPTAMVAEIGTLVKPSTIKGATTYTPTTSNQTIAAGTYCSGAQTIKGDANLVAGNIKKGVSIFGVTGTHEGGGSSGGGSVETCTVTINNGSAFPGYCHATSFEDGSNCYKSAYLAPNKNKTITNVLRNTVIVIYYNTIVIPEVSYTSNAILESSNAGLLVFMVGTESSGNCEIVYRDSGNTGGGSND